jgi:hypothetical protein
MLEFEKSADRLVKFAGILRADTRGSNRGCLAIRDFFWVNWQLAGKQPPESGLASDGGWLNYGVEKLWPAPPTGH